MRKNLIILALLFTSACGKLRSQSILMDTSPEATDGNMSFSSLLSCQGKKIENLGTYEMRTLWNLKETRKDFNSLQEALSFYIDRLEKIDSTTSKFIKDRITSFKIQYRDDLSIERPYSVDYDPLIPGDCRNVSLVKEIERNIIDDPRFIIDKRLWDQLDYIAQAKVMVELALLDGYFGSVYRDKHEYLYSRYVTSYIFSTALDAPDINYFNFWNLTGTAGVALRIQKNSAKFYSSSSENGMTKYLLESEYYNFTYAGIYIYLKKGDSFFISQDGIVLNTKSEKISFVSKKVKYIETDFELESPRDPQNSEIIVSLNKNGMSIAYKPGDPRYNIYFGYKYENNNSFIGKIRSDSNIEYWPNSGFPKKLELSSGDETYWNIDIPKEISVTGSTEYYENGSIKSCMLEFNTNIDGVLYPSDYSSRNTLTFDENGKVISSTKK